LFTDSTLSSTSRYNAVIDYNILQMLKQNSDILTESTNNVHKNQNKPWFPFKRTHRTQGLAYEKVRSQNKKYVSNATATNARKLRKRKIKVRKRKQNVSIESILFFSRKKRKPAANRNQEQH